MVKIKININKIDIKQRKTDDTGRASLGPEYANKKIKLAILEVNEK